MYQQTPLVDDNVKVVAHGVMYQQTNFHASGSAASSAAVPSPVATGLNREQILHSQQEALIAKIQAQIASVDATLISLGIGAAPVACKTFGPPSSSAPLMLSITSSLASPPLATLAVLHTLPNVRVRQFWHSSLSSRPTEATLRAHRAAPAVESPVCASLTWSNAEPHALVVSAVTHVPLVGDATAARFICRQLCPQLYPADDLLALAQIDNWIDRADELQGSARNQKAIIKDANAHLGQHAFLHGAAAGLADFVFWAAMRSNNVQGPPSNIKKWLLAVEALPAAVAALDIATAARTSTA